MDEQNVEARTESEIIHDFVKKYNTLQNEIDMLKQQQKEMFETLSDKLDVKAFKSAIRATKIRQKVDAIDTFDNYCVALEKEVL